MVAAGVKKVLPFISWTSFILDRIPRMNAIDRKILAELQQDARISLTDLAARVGLSLSPCHRRVRALEDSGVISGYRAEVDYAAVGLHFSALVFVVLREGSAGHVRAFEAALVDVQEIVQAQRLFGDPDYLLHVVCRDLEAFRALYDSTLSALPSVQRLSSTLVMKRVLRDRPLPL